MLASFFLHTTFEARSIPSSTPLTSLCVVRAWFDSTKTLEGSFHGAPGPRNVFTDLRDIATGTSPCWDAISSHMSNFKIRVVGWYLLKSAYFDQLHCSYAQCNLSICAFTCQTSPPLRCPNIHRCYPLVSRVLSTKSRTSTSARALQAAIASNARTLIICAWVRLWMKWPVLDHGYPWLPNAILRIYIYISIYRSIPNKKKENRRANSDVASWSFKPSMCPSGHWEMFVPHLKHHEAIQSCIFRCCSWPNQLNHDSKTLS